MKETVKVLSRNAGAFFIYNQNSIRACITRTSWQERLI